MSKNIVSLQIKALEVYVTPLKPGESILTIIESDDEDEDDEEIKTLNISEIEDDILISSFKNNELIFNTIFVLKINQIFKTNP